MPTTVASLIYNSLILISHKLTNVYRVKISGSTLTVFGTSARIRLRALKIARRATQIAAVQQQASAWGNGTPNPSTCENTKKATSGKGKS